MVDSQKYYQHIRQSWHWHMGEITPEDWIADRGYELLEIRHALELRFGDDPNYTAEDLDGAAADLEDILRELAEFDSDVDQENVK